VKRPNFFIIGAPKCGTTSLASWLSSHHQVFLSDPKEPDFFNFDHYHLPEWPIKSQSSYDSLFEDASERHLAVGEASVWYLYSAAAVPNILEYNADAKFIVCLRNPVEMAVSLHRHLVFYAREPVREFERAWRLAEDRWNGRNVRRWSGEPRKLAYNKVCQLGNQVGRLLSNASRERVCFVFLEDLANNARSEYLRVLNFLGLEDDDRRCFPVLNQGKRRKWPVINNTIVALHYFRRRLGMHRSLRLGITAGLDALNNSLGEHDALSAALERELQEYFSADVALLGRLVGRDLSHWCTELSETPQLHPVQL
jgi:hypothetical protein